MIYLCLSESNITFVFATVTLYNACDFNAEIYLNVSRENEMRHKCIKRGI